MGEVGERVGVDWAGKGVMGWVEEVVERVVVDWAKKGVVG